MRNFYSVGLTKFKVTEPASFNLNLKEKNVLVLLVCTRIGTQYSKSKMCQPFFNQPVF